jgi:hypothetical protein
MWAISSGLWAVGCGLGEIFEARGRDRDSKILYFEDLRCIILNPFLIYSTFDYFDIQDKRGSLRNEASK